MSLETVGQNCSSAKLRLSQSEIDAHSRAYVVGSRAGGERHCQDDVDWSNGLLAEVWIRTSKIFADLMCLLCQLVERTRTRISVGSLRPPTASANVIQKFLYIILSKL